MVLAQDRCETVRVGCAGKMDAVRAALDREHGAVQADAERASGSLARLHLQQVDLLFLKVDAPVCVCITPARNTRTRSSSACRRARPSSRR